MALRYGQAAGRMFGAGAVDGAQRSDARGLVSALHRLGPDQVNGISIGYDETYGPWTVWLQNADAVTNPGAVNPTTIFGANCKRSYTDTAAGVVWTDDAGNFNTASFGAATDPVSTTINGLLAFDFTPTSGGTQAKALNMGNNVYSLSTAGVGWAIIQTSTVMNTTVILGMVHDTYGWLLGMSWVDGTGGPCALVNFTGIGQAGYVNLARSLADGNPHVVVWVFDGYTIKLYVDGILAGSNQVGDSVRGVPFTIGNNSATDCLAIGAEVRSLPSVLVDLSSTFSGKIGSCGFANVAPSSTQLAQLHAFLMNRAGLTFPSITNVGQWNGKSLASSMGGTMSDGSGYTCADVAGIPDLTAGAYPQSGIPVNSQPAMSFAANTAFSLKITGKSNHPDMNEVPAFVQDGYTIFVVCNSNTLGAGLRPNIVSDTGSYTGIVLDTSSGASAVGFSFSAALAGNVSESLGVTYNAWEYYDYRVARNYLQLIDFHHGASAVATTFADTDGTQGGPIGVGAGDLLGGGVDPTGASRYNGEIAKVQLASTRINDRWMTAHKAATVATFGMATYAISIAESIGAPTDGVTRLTTPKRSVTETIAAMTDALARSSTTIRAVPENVPAPTDSPARLTADKRSIGENVTVPSDAVVRVLGRTRAITETITIPSDGVARAFADSRSIAETLVAVADSLVRTSADLRSIAESITKPSDVVTAARGWSKAIAETLIIVSDGVTRVTTSLRPLSENVTAVADSVARSSTDSRNVSETLTVVSDGVARAATAHRSISESVTAVSDLVSRIVASLRSIPAENVPAPSDAVSRQENLLRNVPESIAAALDSLVRATVDSRSVGESITQPSIALSRLTALLRSISETFGAPSDSVSMVYTPAGGGAHPRSVGETIGAPTDGVIRITVNARGILESVTIVSDGVIRRAPTARVIPESTGILLDGVTRVATFLRVAQESVGVVSDALIGVHTFNRGLTETIGAPSIGIVRLVNYLRRIPEAVSASDAISRIASASRAMSEAILVPIDVATNSVSRPRSISESIPAAFDVVSMRAAFLRLPVEQLLAPDDSVQRQTMNIRVLGESLSRPSDAVGSQFNHPRSISEIILAPNDFVTLAVTRHLPTNGGLVAREFQVTMRGSNSSSTFSSTSRVLKPSATSLNKKLGTK